MTVPELIQKLQGLPGANDLREVVVVVRQKPSGRWATPPQYRVLRVELDDMQVTLSVGAR